jgi:hypothetical protein
MVEYSKSGDECIDCSDATGYAPIFVAAAMIAAMLLGCVVVSRCSRKAEDADQDGGAAKGAAGALYGAAQDSMDAGGNMVEDAGGGQSLMVMSKILIGLIQMLSELPAALALSFPDAFTAVLNVMKVFLLDVFEVFRVDCVQPLSLHAKFIVIMVLPFVGAGIVQLLRCVADARAGRGNANAEMVAQRKAKNKANSRARLSSQPFAVT